MALAKPPLPFVLVVVHYALLTYMVPLFGRKEKVASKVVYVFDYGIFVRQLNPKAPRSHLPGRTRGEHHRLLFIQRALRLY